MPTYCTINEAYGPSFNKTQKKESKESSNTEDTKKTDSYASPIQKVSLKDGYGPMNGEKFVCPTCSQCLRDNNWFQQQVIQQANWPLPRWIPQGVTNPNISPYDPWNRYFGHTEHFGNVETNFLPSFNFSKEHFGAHGELTNKSIFKILLYFLISLFSVTLIEIILKL